MKYRPLLGETVISVGNEWDTMTVGKVTGFLELDNGTQTPIPLVADVVQKVTYTCMGMTIPYSEIVLGILLKLNPYERWNIMAGLMYPDMISSGFIKEDKPKEVPGAIDPSLQDYINALEKTGE